MPSLARITLTPVACSYGGDRLLEQAGRDIEAARRRILDRWFLEQRNPRTEAGLGDQRLQAVRFLERPPGFIERIAPIPADEQGLRDRFAIRGRCEGGGGDAATPEGGRGHQCAQGHPRRPLALSVLPERLRNGLLPSLFARSLVHDGLSAGEPDGHVRARHFLRMSLSFSSEDIADQNSRSMAGVSEVCQECGKQPARRARTARPVIP